MDLRAWVDMRSSGVAGVSRPGSRREVDHQRLDDAAGRPAFADELLEPLDDIRREEAFTGLLVQRADELATQPIRALSQPSISTISSKIAGGIGSQCAWMLSR